MGNLDRRPNHIYIIGDKTYRLSGNKVQPCTDHKVIMPTKKGLFSLKITERNIYTRFGTVHHFMHTCMEFKAMDEHRSDTKTKQKTVAIKVMNKSK